jgi:hypothetical protein
MNLLRGLPLLLLAGLALAAGFSSTAEEMIRLNFADGTLAGWSTKRVPQPHSIQVQSQIVHRSRYAARVELRPGDYVSEGWRAELTDGYNAPVGGDVWYAFATYVPVDYPVGEDNICVLAQWHDQAEPGVESGKPMLAHRYNNGRFYVTHDGEGIRQMVLYEDKDFARGRWHDFVYHVLWTPEAGGAIDGWIDGRPVVRFRGSTMYPGQSRGPYFKFGVYCAENVKRPHVAYHADYARGRTPEAVDAAGLAAVPAGSGG